MYGGEAVKLHVFEIGFSFPDESEQERFDELSAEADEAVESTSRTLRALRDAELAAIPDAIPGLDEIDAFVESARECGEAVGLAFKKLAESFNNLSESLRQFFDEIVIVERDLTRSGWTRYAPLMPQSWIPRRLVPSRGISPRRNRGRSLPGGKWAAMRLA